MAKDLIILLEQSLIYFMKFGHGHLGGGRHDRGFFDTGIEFAGSDIHPIFKLSFPHIKICGATMISYLSTRSLGIEAVLSVTSAIFDMNASPTCGYGSFQA